MFSVWLDTRYAFRGLRRSPGFTALAVISLALGLGAVVAVFTLLNALVLRELQVREPQTLVDVRAVRPQGRPTGLTFPMFRELETRQRAFSSLIGWWGGAVINVEVGRTLVRGNIWAVTGNFYTELGAVPAFGRLLVPSDIDWNTLEPARVAVLGFGFWQRTTGGDPTVVGQTLRIDDVPFTIVGVARAGFTGFGVVGEPEVTIPLTAEPLVTRGTLDRLYASDSAWVRVVGRLNPGITIESARAQLDAVWPELKAAAVPPGYVGAQRDEFLALPLSVESASRGFEPYYRSRFGPALYAVGGVAALVFLIATINLASLLFARTSERTREVHVRLAIGGSRWRVARQLLIEGALLSVAGAAGGLILAYWASVGAAAVMLEGQFVPAFLDVRPDARVVAFTVVAALLAVGLFTSLPIAWVTRHDIAEHMRSGARTMRGASRTGRVLIGAQVAFCFVMLTLAALLMRTAQELRTVPVGYSGDEVLALALYPVPGGYRGIDLDSYYPTLLERIRALPAVRAAALAAYQPGAGFAPTRIVHREGEPSGAGHTVVLGQVTNSFFATLDLAILKGRDFSERDSSTSLPVTILSRSLADDLFQSEDPIGRTVLIGDAREGQRVQVVGIVPDVRLYDAKNPNTAALYIPLAQEKWALYSRLLVRTNEGPTIIGGIREAVRAFGREQIIYAGPLNEMRERAMLQERLASMSGAFFGAIALLLSAVGLYGLVAFNVAQRTSEIGVRMALGAQRSQVLGMVGHDALRVAISGIVLGVPLALAASWGARGLFFGVRPGDPWTMAVAAGLLVSVSVIAAIRPARRAAGVDPIKALRAE